MFSAKLLKTAEDAPLGDKDKIHAYLLRMGDMIYKWLKELLPDHKVDKTFGSGYYDERITIDGHSRFVLMRGNGTQTQGYPVIRGVYYQHENEVPIDPEVVEDMFLGAGFKKKDNDSYEFTIGSYVMSDNVQVVDEILRELKDRFDQNDANYNSLVTLMREFEPHFKGPDGEQLRHYVFLSLKQMGERQHWMKLKGIEVEEDRTPGWGYTKDKAIFGIGDKGTISIHIPSFLFFLAGKGMFNAKDQAEALRIARTVMNKIKKVVKDNPDRLFNIVGFYGLMDMDPKLHDEGIKILRKIIGEKYHYLNSYETVKMINQEKDHYKRKEMMESLTKELELVLHQMDNLSSGKSW
jgi:hypothetical protein